MKQNKVRPEDLRLYAITDRRWLGNKKLSDDVEAVLKGGATFIQLREKHLDTDAFRDEAKVIQKICAAYGVPLIINDNVEVAKAIGADGKGDPIVDQKEIGKTLVLRGASFTREGCTQTGWAMIDGGEPAYALDSIYDTDAPIALYPVWTAKRYTVKFDTDGGSAVTDRTDLLWTDKVIEAVPAPTKDGWTFVGWRCGDAAVGQSTTYADLAENDTVSSITLTAQW